MGIRHGAFGRAQPLMARIDGGCAVVEDRGLPSGRGGEEPRDPIRAEFAESVGENSVHGSDAPETAAQEIAFFFSGLELVG